MENLPVGYRFYPTDEELINHYLKNKIRGKTWLVDEAINEIKINDYKPMHLPSLSKIQSKDPIWYFFARIVYTTKGKKKERERTTKCKYGYWKSTGPDREIKDKNGNKIGKKKTLVFHLKQDDRRIPWIMHEYEIHIKSWFRPVQESYVICKIMYNGEDYDDCLLSRLQNIDREKAKHFLSDQEFMTQENYNPEVKNGLSVNDLENLIKDKQKELVPNRNDILLQAFPKYGHGFNQRNYYGHGNNDEYFNQAFKMEENYDDHKPSVHNPMLFFIIIFFLFFLFHKFLK